MPGVDATVPKETVEVSPVRSPVVALEIKVHVYEKTDINEDEVSL